MCPWHLYLVVSLQLQTPSQSVGTALIQYILHLKSLEGGVFFINFPNPKTQEQKCKRRIKQCVCLLVIC